MTVITLSDLEVYRFTPELVGLSITDGGCFAEVRQDPNGGVQTNTSTAPAGCSAS